MKAKRLLTALTSLILTSVSILPIPSNAETIATRTDVFSAAELASLCYEDGFTDCIDVLQSNSEHMDISGDLSSAYIGTPFFINYIDDKYSVTENKNNAYFPVVADNDVCAFIIATKNNNAISYSCGKYFADTFDETGVTGDFALLFDKNENLYLVDENQKISVIIEYYDPLEITPDVLKDDSLSVTSIDDAMTMIRKTPFESASPKSINIIMNYQLSGYPSCVQSGANCWAYAILSMAKYKLGSSYTIGQVYSAYYTGNGSSYVYNSGATLTQAYNTIVALFSGYSPVKYSSGVLPSGVIASTIGNDLPSYIRGTSSAGNGHAVALMGYRMDSDYHISGNVCGIYTMNPQNGAVNYNSYSPNGCSFSGTSTTYSWNGSVTLQ